MVVSGSGGPATPRRPSRRGQRRGRRGTTRDRSPEFSSRPAAISVKRRARLDRAATRRNRRRRLRASLDREPEPRACLPTALAAVLGLRAQPAGIGFSHHAHRSRAARRLGERDQRPRERPRGPHDETGEQAAAGSHRRGRFIRPASRLVAQSDLTLGRGPSTRTTAQSRAAAAVRK